MTLELIAEIGPDEPLATVASVTAEAFGSSIFLGDSSQVAVLTSTPVNGVPEPWLAGDVFCGGPCTLVDQAYYGNPSRPRPVDPFQGVIATLIVDYVLEGSVWARAEDFFGASDVGVHLLLVEVPEPSSAGLIGLGVLAFALARRRAR